ncbi:MAG: primosomal protein N', partial [Oscillospiraceae bacterium]
MDILPEGKLAADIAVEGTLYGFDSLFSYEIPDDLRDRVRAGMRVVVPFGRGNKKRVGLVFAVHPADPAVKCKPIRALADSEPVLNEEMLTLCAWIRDNTFCTYFDAFRAILPPGLGYSLKTHYSLSKDFNAELSEEEEKLVQVLKSAGDRAAFEGVLADEQERGGKLLSRLVEKGVLVEDSVLKRRVGDESVQMLRLAEETPDKTRLTPKQ